MTIAENIPTHSRAKAKTLYKTYIEQCISFSSLLGLQSIHSGWAKKAGIISVVDRPRRNVNANSEPGGGSGEQTGESCAKPAL